MKILEADSITKIYNKNNISVTALDNVNLSIEKGEFVSIMGTSGSGKTTLLHIMGGLDIPTNGNVIVEGNSVTDDLFNENEKTDMKFFNLNSMKDKLLSAYRREKIGFIFQEYNLVPILTLEENIELPIRFSNRKVDKEYINELLNIFGISDRRNHYPNQTSGGQQQRAAIARALSNRPSIILADEPTGNLDMKNSIEVMEYLKKCNKYFKQTIVMVTHDTQIARYADRIIIIEDGKIIE